MMKYFTYIFLLFTIIGCQTKNCKQWYSGLKMTPVTSINNGNQIIENWFSTDFFNNELNFEITFHYSADGYEECKSQIMIHEIINDSTFICCGNYLIINNDTIKAFENLRKYFTLSETEGHQLLEFDKHLNNFPIFEQSNNTFYIKLYLSDNNVLKDSCVVKILKK